MAQTKSKTESAFDSVIPMDVPVAMRDMAEQGVAQAKDAYAKMKVVADQTTELVEGTYASTFKGLSTLGQKSIETARANSNAAFDHAMAMFGVKTISDAIELQTAFMRKQSESMTAQAKEMGELVQKLAGDVTAPVKTTMEKAMKLSA
jgi:phasin